MDLPQLAITNLMTAEQISEAVGVSRIAVFKRNGLNKYFVGAFPNPSGMGAPVKMYRPEALSLWGKSDNDIRVAAHKAERKGRSDKGSIRKSKKGKTWITEEQLQAALQLVKQLYINNGQANLVYACEKAAEYMNQVPGHEEITGKRLHRRLQRKDKYFRSEFFTENWEFIRRSELKKWDHKTKDTGTLKYNWWQIMESAGVAGKGHGACQVIVIDDFKRDAWVQREGLLEMPGGIAYTDGLTGYPLLIMPAKSINTETVAAGMVMVAYAYNLPENAIWVMENSKVMKNVNIEMLVRSMYTKQELYDFENGNIEWVKNVFEGCPGPIVRNLPHIPRHAFKARIERYFKLIKDEFDAPRFPMNYQGGSRQEATQLTLARMPMVVGAESKDMPKGFYTIEYEEYWKELYSWLYSDFVMRQRPKMLHEWSKEKTKETGNRITATIYECWNYYRDSDYKRETDPERLAYLLYWAQPKRHEPRALWTVDNMLFIRPTIKGRTLNLFSSEIHEGVIGRKVATVPIPNVDNRFLIFIADDPKRPEFLCIAEDFTGRDHKQIPAMRRKVAVAREEISGRLKDQASKKFPFRNTHEQVSEPKLKSLPTESDGIMRGLEEEITTAFGRASLPPKKEDKNTEPRAVEIAEDMADLLGDIDNLLND